MITVKKLLEMYESDDYSIYSNSQGCYVKDTVDLNTECKSFYKDGLGCLIFVVD